MLTYFTYNAFCVLLFYIFYLPANTIRRPKKQLSYEALLSCLTICNHIHYLPYATKPY